MLTIPVNGITDITTYLGTLIADFWPVIVLVIGVMLSFDVINRIIKLVARVIAEKGK